MRRGAHQVSSLIGAGSSEEVSFSFLALPSCGIFFPVFLCSTFFVVEGTSYINCIRRRLPQSKRLHIN